MKSLLPKTSPLLVLALALPAQRDGAAAVDAAAQAPEAGELRYPRDKERVIAVVGGDDLTVEQMIQHLDQRHAPGFSEYLATEPGNLYFQAPQRFGADWVRQYADIEALKAEARARGLDLNDADPFLSDALKRMFEVYLQGASPAQGINPEETRKVLAYRLSRFQQENGMKTEVQGWLDFLVSGEAPDGELRNYMQGNARKFGALVTFSQILIVHRDPVTLRLQEGQARARAWEKVADIKARLKQDGSNFEDVAGRYSEDRKTAQRGGLFRNVSRFDSRLPAILCRTAWQLEDGQWTGPVESAYGLHFVKRITLEQQRFILYSEQTKPIVMDVRRKHLQEDLLYAAREKHGVKLLY